MRADSTNPDSTQDVGGNQVDTLSELYGIRIFIDNRIKYGNLLPYKNRTDSFRCSKVTLDRIKRELKKQDADELRHRLIWATRYGLNVINSPWMKVRGITA